MNAANNWFKEFRNNPQEIIKWAENEIKNYQKLISIIKKVIKK